MMICMKSASPTHPVQMSTAFSTLESLALSDNRFEIFPSFGFFRLSLGSAQPEGIPLYIYIQNLEIPQLWQLIQLVRVTPV